MIHFLRRRRVASLQGDGKGRRIRIHSLTPDGGLVRIAFEFLDPPGPKSLQFYEAAPGQEALLTKLAPGTETSFHEGSDEGRTRLLVSPDGEPVWPR